MTHKLVLATAALAASLIGVSHARAGMVQNSAACRVISGTPQYITASGQLSNNTTGTVTLACPVAYNTSQSLPPSVTVDAWSNGCTGPSLNIRMQLCKASMNGGNATCAENGSPDSCTASVIHHLVPAPSLNAGDSLFLLIDLGPSGSGGQNTLFGYRLN